VQDTISARPDTSNPALVAVSASTSLAGSSRSSTAASRTCFGNGICTRMPCTFLSAFSAFTRASTSASLAFSGKL
jgi:hypothetical protein